MDVILQNIRYALRRLSKAPGFTAVVVLTLALGIGANSTIFSVVSSVLLRPLPYPEPGELVTINHFYPSLGDLKAPVSASGFIRYRDQTRSFDAVAVASGGGANLSINGTPERVDGARVSADFFKVFGVAPALGRVPLPEEDAPGSDRVVVLTNGFWQRAFGADPKAIGRTVSLNGEPHEVIGVMPPDFVFFGNPGTEIIRPLALTTEQLTAGGTTEWLNLAARLKPGVSVDDAAAEMARIAERMKQDAPDEYPPTWTLTVTTLNEVQKGNLRAPMMVLFAAVGIVLLIACANVANLMLARSTARTREIAIRSSLGAGRRQLVAQLVTEAVVLALAGGLLGILIALWSVAALGQLLSDELPGIQMGVDAPVLLFTLALSLVTGVAFGLFPALHASRPNLQSVMRESSRAFAGDRAGNLARRALVVGEMAIALTLLAGAGLLIRSLRELQQVDPGFRAENVLTFQVALPETRYADEAQRTAFFERALEGIRATPGVTAAGLTSVLPFGGGWSTGSFTVEGYQPKENEPNPWGDQRIVSPGFDRALGVSLVKGRFIDERDVAGAPLVAVVDEELVRRYWPNEDPIGKRISEDEGVWLTVVGVVRHTKHAGLNDQDRVQVYFPYRQIGEGGMDQATFAVRTSGDPLATLGAVRRVIGSIDRDQPLARVEAMTTLVDRSLQGRRLSVQLLTIFSGLAALLAALGIYGVISHMVAQRTRELGVRMALGAAANEVLVMVLRQGLGLAMAGVGLGLVGAFALTRLIASQLFGVQPTDPATFAATAMLLVLVAVVATLLPAGRAARVDPMVALRAE
jgi:putative ABC transport system permease protein